MKTKGIKGEGLPWVVSVIRRLRPDVSCNVGDKVSTSFDRFLFWLITSGIKEYKALQEDRSFLAYLAYREDKQVVNRLQLVIYKIRKDVQVVYPLPDSVDAYLNWFNHYGIKEHKLEFLVSAIEKENSLCGHPMKYPEDCEKKRHAGFSNRPFGVNLIGYAYGQLGIGEDLRMAAVSLHKSGIPFTILNFSPGSVIPQDDDTVAEYVSDDAPYAVNIFCLTAIEHARFYVTQGSQLIIGRYNIGYWPWELSKWPDAWLDLTQLVDEVWVSTRHTYDALSSVSPVPVLIMPMAVEIGEVSDKTRKDFSLPEGVKLFCFSFDLNSSIHRKNPQACLDAFVNAFSMAPELPRVQDKVGLVIKVHRPKEKHVEWEKLKSLAHKDMRVFIIEETLSRPDLLALYKVCDCFLSLHRAEGFGRGIAEAIQLGLHVITTGYSGNVDFCHPPQTSLVDYKLIKVKSGQYAYAENQVWASADINHAIRLMKSFANNDSGANVGEIGKENEFNPEVVGRRYKARLKFICCRN